MLLISKYTVYYTVHIYNSFAYIIVVATTLPSGPRSFEWPMFGKNSSTLLLLMLGTGDVIWCSKTKRPRGFFTRGGVGSLRTPSKNSFAALQDLCRPCSTVQSPGESSDRALKAHDIQANVLRTCSTKISHWLRPGSDGKSNGSKIKSVQKDNGLLKNVRSWTCKICGFQLEGQRYRDSRGKIDYHLHSIHAAKY